MTYDPNRHHRRSIRLKGYDYSRPGAYFITIVAQDRACLFGKVVDGVMHLSEVGQIVAESWQWLAAQYDYVTLDAWVVMPNHIHGIIVITDQGGDDGGRGGSRTAPTANAPTTSNAPTAPDALTVNAPTAPDAPTVNAPTAPDAPTVNAPTAPDAPTVNAPTAPDAPTVNAPTANAPTASNAPTAPDAPTASNAPTAPDAPTASNAPTANAPTTNAPTAPAKRKTVGRLVGAFKTVSTKRINDQRGTPGAQVWQRDFYEHIIRDAAALARIRRYIVENPARWASDPENRKW